MKKILIVIGLLLVLHVVSTSAQTTLLLPEIQGDVYQIIDEGAGVFVFGSVQPESGEYIQIGQPLSLVKGLSSAVSTLSADSYIQQGEDEFAQRNLFIIDLTDGTVTPQPFDIVLASLEQDTQGNLYGFETNGNLMVIDQSNWTTQMITNVALTSVSIGPSAFGNDEYFVKGGGLQGSASISQIVAINVTTGAVRRMAVDYSVTHFAHRESDNKLVGAVTVFAGTANFPFFAVIDPLTGQIEQGYRLDPYIASLSIGLSAIDANDNYLFPGGDWDGNSRLYAITPGDNVLHIGPIQTKRAASPAAVTLKSFEVKRPRVLYLPLVLR